MFCIYRCCCAAAGLVIIVSKPLCVVALLYTQPLWYVFLAIVCSVGGLRQSQRAGGSGGGEEVNIHVHTYRAAYNCLNGIQIAVNVSLIGEQS